MSLFVRYVPLSISSGGGGGGSSLTIGTINSQAKSANGGVIAADELIFQTADGSFPGLVSTGAQTIAGAKTFSAAPIFSSVTASQLLAVDGSKALTSLARGNLTDVGTDGISITGGTNAVIGNVSIAQQVADATHNGYLSSTDWNTFNNKQPSGSYVTAVSVATSNGFAGSSSGTTTPTLTLSTTVTGILEGNGTAISAASTTGTGAVVLADTPTLITPNIGAATGTSLNLSGLTASQAVVTDGSKNLASLAYASSNTASALVQRDGSGDFSAGTITASLTGTASGNTTITPSNHAVVLSSASNALSTAAPSATSGVALVSNGSSSDPSFGTVVIAGGGTGATTKSAAFDALSPMSASGDIIYGGTAGTGTRLAKGNDGDVLTLASGIPSWAAPSGSSTAPTVQRFTSGSGTYTTPSAPAPLYIRVKMAGGGGGGGGTSADGGDGGTSTFGTSLLTANGGTKGIGNQGSLGGAAPAGGTVTVSAPALAIIAVSGGDGTNVGGNTTSVGGNGGVNPLGGGGIGGSGGPQPTAGKTNTGAGGGGAYAGGGAANAGSGGAAGGYIEAIITSPGSSYSYAVGAAGSAGTGGSPGAGGSGIIVVEEYYQ